MDDLPIEMLLHIGSMDYRVWRGLLVFRRFAKYTMTLQCRAIVLRVFAHLENPAASLVGFLFGRSLWCTELEGMSHSYFDLPANGSMWAKQWCHKGRKHRVGGPAYIRTSHTAEDLIDVIEGAGIENYRPATYAHPKYGRGFTASISWYYGGQCHRDDGPAALSIEGDSLHANWKISWYRGGQRHREDGPAEIQHHTTSMYNGCDWVYSATWYINGKLEKKYEGNIPLQ